MVEQDEESPAIVAKEVGEGEETNSLKRESAEDDDVVRLAGLEFEDRDALWNHVQTVQKQLDENVPLKSEDSFFLCMLLSKHPSSHEKMVPGISSFGYGANEEFPDTKSFFVVRTDESRVAFSARKCVDALCSNADAAPSKKRKIASFETGSVVLISGLEGQAVSRNEIRIVLNRIAPVKHVQVDEDVGTATVRFDTAKSAQLAVGECADINGCKATLAIATPEQEEQFKTTLSSTNWPPDRHRNGGGGGSRGRGGFSSRGGSRGGGGGGGRRGRSRGGGKLIGRGVRGGGGRSYS